MGGGGPMNMFGGAPNFGGPNGAPTAGPSGADQGDNQVALALNELKTALANTNTLPDEIKEKVEAVHTARRKADATLAAAEQNLRQLLTPDQEIVLVSLGYLE
jgi:hypothetical protein